MTVLQRYGVPAKIGRLIEQMYSGTWCQVKGEGELSEKFEVSTGARHLRMRIQEFSLPSLLSTGSGSMHDT